MSKGPQIAIIRDSSGKVNIVPDPESNKAPIWGVFFALVLFVGLPLLASVLAYVLTRI